LADSFVSRRISEVTGVALFAATLLCLISLVSYSKTTRSGSSACRQARPRISRGASGAFVSEASFQLLGYSAVSHSGLLGYLAWHYFWCTKIEAGYTKLFGIAMLFGSVAGLLDLASSPFDTSGSTSRPAALIGKALATLCAAFLNRTGASILLLTLLAFSVILSTQYSLGAAFTRGLAEDPKPSVATRPLSRVAR
jgi:hypothetical protein